MIQWVLMGLGIVSTPAVAFTGIGYMLQRAENHRLRCEVNRLMENRHGGLFHRCSSHDSSGISPNDERARDLSEIRARWERPYRNRTD